MYVRDWSKYMPYFRESEFACKHTGVCKMEVDFMDKLMLLRIACGFPFIINSGYRAASHPIEAAKKAPGEHYYGRAADIRAYGKRAFELIKNAPHYGFLRIGVQQAGHAGSRYLHLGTSTEEQGFESPTPWSY
jgi:zinc D-Ala-D-Ala carboxypeptidase